MGETSQLLGLRGYLIDSPEYGKLRAWNDGALVVDGGRIAEVGNYEILSKRERDRDIHWVDSTRNVIFPGLIDLHTHLPQYPAVARGESSLLPWLRQHIFPLERDFTGPRSHKLIPRFFEELAAHGTTTAVVYSAIFEDSCHKAFEAAEELGIRAVIGKTMMDVGSYGNHQPRKVVSISLHEAERLCKKWNGANEGLLDYAFSPRFAVSCSEKLMEGAAKMASGHGAYIQTHLAENEEEIGKVKHQFSQSRNYADVYRSCGLLGGRTILGHCIHLSDEEIGILSESGSAVAHCPTSNFFLGSGLMPYDRLRKAGLRIGLGSDVAAGPELNLWQVMRSMIESQKARFFHDSSVEVPGPKEAFHAATMGGAAALGKEGAIGSFEIGKEADLVVMDIGEMLPYPREQRMRHDLSPEDIISLAVYRGGPHAVVASYVRGRRIYQAPERGLF